MEPGPFLVLGALIAGLLVGEGTGVSVANGALIVGAGALGAAWFARPPARLLLAAAACALLGCAVMSRAVDGQQHSPLGTAMERRDTTTVRGEATEDPSGPMFEASVLVRVDVGHGAHSARPAGVPSIRANGVHGTVTVS